ncbi:hypothetical protein [Rhodoferax koreensis]|uniref:hypothetical protein n=1 Tax=Rhodoferax koreensis TaxID=1842727 RepID=UPI0012FF767C|nr:hypothetical protein [Rhodoferax koreense]
MNWTLLKDKQPPVDEDILCWKAGRGYELMHLNKDGRLVDEDGGWYTDKENEPSHWCVIDTPK